MIAENKDELDIPEEHRLMSRRLSSKEMLECFAWMKQYADMIHIDLEEIGNEFHKEANTPGFDRAVYHMVIDKRKSPEILTLFKLAWG